MSETLLSAIITAGMAFLGVYVSNRKSAALVEYRLKQLEEKVQAHNNLVERMYAVEEKTSLQEEKIRVANHRINDLEAKQ